MKHFLSKSLVLKAMLFALIFGATTTVLADDYKLYSGELTEGDYLIVYNGKAMKAAISSNRFSYETVTPAEDVITTTDATIVWTVAADGKYFTLYNASTGKYAGGNGTKNQGALLSSVEDKARWTVTGDATYEFVNKYNSSKDVNCNLRNNGTYGFACYSTSTGGALSLYKFEKSAAPICSTPTFSPAAGTFTSTQNVTISSEDGATIYYTTDGSEPTTDSNVYSAAIEVSTTTTIKAIAVADGYDDSAVASATYTIVTIEHAGSEADPYTVADARNAIDAGTGITGVYVRGIVCVGGSNLSSGALNYWISDDGTATDKFEVYKGKGIDGANFTSADDIKVGDVVVVTGDLQKYNTTYEFSAGNELFSLYRAPEKEEPGLSYSAASVVITVGDAFVAPTLSNPNDLTVSYESSNTSLATVTPAGVVSLVEDATGTATITASFAGDETYKAGSASYIITVNVAAGDKTYVALIAEYKGSYYAINSTSGATWGATEVNVVNDKVINAQNDALLWDIAAYGTGVTIQNKATNEFIGYKSTGTDLQASNTSVKWDIDNENKSWTNQNGKTSGTVRTLLFNGTGFKNYATSNVNGVGYSDYTTAYSTFADGYVRDLTSMSSTWGTICLPSTVEAEDVTGATFYSIAGKYVDGSGNPIALALEEEADGLVGGVPYIFEATEGATKIVAAYQDDNEDAGSNNGLIGSLTGQDVAEGMYLISGGNVIKCGTGCSIGANRAYIDMSQVSTVSNVKGMTLLYIGGATPTGIEAMENAQKDNAPIFNLAGQRVNKAQKGIYIQNGKKFIVK